MSSERRSIDGDLPDGVVPEGQAQNPNPPEQVAANRARFEATQEAIQQDRLEAAEQIRAVQGVVETQYRQSMNDPEHQAFIPEQIAHELHEPPHDPGGQETPGTDFLVTGTLQQADTVRPIPQATTPRAAEEGQ